MLEPVRRPAAIVAHRRWPSPALIAQGLAVTLFFSLAALRFTIAPLDRYDEGVTLTKAALTAAGSIPFRDSWITYGPPATYALAAAFNAFGINLVIERGLGAWVRVLLCLVTHAAPWRLGLR